MEQERLATVTLPGAGTYRRSLSRLGRRGRAVVSLRRAAATVDPATDPTLQDGDTLVLSGRPETLANAEEILLEG